jgi:hypothetical protein
VTEKVVELFAVNTLANDNAGLARHLHCLADDIEQGKQGDLANVVVLLSAESLELLALGKGMNVTHMVGLLAIAQAKAISECVGAE